MAESAEGPRIEALVGRALARAVAGETAVVAATPAMPVGEIIAAARRLADDSGAAVAIRLRGESVVIEAA